MDTQNITLAIPKDILHRVKVIAAERQTSVSNLLTQALVRIVQQEDEYAAQRVAEVSKGLITRLTSGQKAGCLQNGTICMRAVETLEFVDTKILIYAHDQSAGLKYEQAKQVLTALWENRNGCISVQVLQEFYVNVTQKVARPLSPEVAAQIIAELGTWRVHRPEVEDVLAAINLQSRYRISFWDAMILVSAMALQCERVWSEDLNAGQRFETLSIVNPFAG